MKEADSRRNEPMSGHGTDDDDGKMMKRSGYNKELVGLKHVYFEMLEHAVSDNITITNSLNNTDDITTTFHDQNDDS